ncbi:zeta toxin-domain-containing protein [Apiospora arundinis]
MHNRPYSTAGPYAHVSSRHGHTERHRHSAAPATRPQSTQPRYVAYRSSQPPLAPRPQRPSGPHHWVNGRGDHESAPVHETRSRQTTYSRHETPSSRPTEPRQHTGQTFETFLAPQPARRRNIWLRIFCGSGDSPERTNARVVTGDTPQTRSAYPSQPSASARRRARLAGDPEAPYRTRTGYNAESGQTYYASRHQ